MPTFAEIQQLADRIAAEFLPRRIVLFGSHAYGQPGADSDVDLLVIMPFEGSPLRQAVELVRGKPRAFPLDLIVRSPEEVAVQYAHGDPLIRDALDRGRVLYEVAA